MPSKYLGKIPEESPPSFTLKKLYKSISYSVAKMANINELCCKKTTIFIWLQNHLQTQFFGLGLELNINPKIR
jgi:hypothetical protein